MLIAAIGIPGCGKSTVMRLFGETIGAPTFLEPEEEKWPDAIKNREKIGYFNSIHAFRCIRVPDLYKASDISKAGGVAIVDTYCDKLCGHWLGRPGMEWLLRPDDPYFSNFKDTALLDYKHLPDADVLIAFHVGKKDWTKMIAARGRTLDVQTQIAEQFDTQQYFQQASETYVSERQGKCKLIGFENPFGAPSEAVQKLRDAISAAGIHL
jgi:hypothetical protein